MLKKGCIFLFVILAMCLLSNLAFGTKDGPRPGKKNPVTPNRASLFCDDELLFLVGRPEQHKMVYTPFVPTKADLSDWSYKYLPHNYLDSEYGLINGDAPPWASAQGRISDPSHDQVASAFFRPDGDVQVELWDYPAREGPYVRLSGTTGTHPIVDVAVGNLDLLVDENGYDHDEIVVVRTTDGNVQVDVLDHNLSSLASVSVPANYKPYKLTVATGDFDGDGNLEFAVAQTGFVNEYQIDVFRFTRDGNPSLDKFLTKTIGMSESAVFNMTAGDFNGDVKDDIAVAYANLIVFFQVVFSQTDDDFSLEEKQKYIRGQYLDPYEQDMVSGLFKFDPGSGYGPGRRQLAIYTQDDVDGCITIYAIKNNWDVEKSGELCISPYKNVILTAGNFIGHDSQSPLMDIAFSAFWDVNNRLKILGLRDGALEDLYSWNVWWPAGLMHTALVAYDKDGDTYRLGPPAHITIENLIGLDYVIQEPPKHVDYLPKDPDHPEGEWEMKNVSADKEFYVEFKDEKDQTVATETTDTSSRTTGGSAELDVSATVSGGLGNIEKVSLSAESDTKIGYEYNSSKSSYESDYSSRSVSYSSQTNTDDFLHGKYQLLDIWRYPIYALNTGDADNPHAFQEIILPGPWERFGNGGLSNADWYQPIHQNRNVLSYPSLDDQDFPSDLGSFTLPDGTKVTDIMNEGAIRSWDGNAQTINVKWTDTAGSGKEKTYNHTLSKSEDITIGTSAKASFLFGSAEVDASVKLNFHNTNSWGGSTTENTTNSESTGILINVPAGTGREQAYNFRSAIYVSSGGGAFKVAHATDPLGSTLGADWWRSQYGRKPDPALNLPNRFEEQDDGSWTLKAVDDDTRKRMRGFFLRAHDPDPISGKHELLGEMLTDGDVVNVCARVYNFSLSQPTGYFGIWWLYVPFDSGPGKEVGERKIIAGYNIDVDPMEMKEYCHAWDTTGLSEMSEGDSYRLYVILDPNEVLDDEIHEWKDADGNLLLHGNNEGYWPWSNGIIIAPKESMASKGISDVDISMHDESLAVKMPDGIVSQGPVSLTVGEHYMLRAHIVSNALHPHYRYALLYDGDPDQGGEVLASAVVRGVVEGDNYVWIEWTPKEPGDCEFWVALLEDSDDPNRGNASDMLKVSVYQPMACCEVNFMKAADKKQGRSDDKIKIKGSLKLVQWAEPFEPETDVVCVTIDDQVITIPAGSFEAKHTSGLIQYSFKGDIPDVGHVHMRLNFDECRWWIDIRGKDASDLVQNDGAYVGLTIGTNVGEDSFEWTRKTKRNAMFNEAPPLLCCPDSP